MATFIYTAKVSPSKTIQGRMDAQTKQEAIDKITKLGYFPILVAAEDISSEKQGMGRFWKFSKKDVVLLTSQLAMLLEAGINIINSLNIVINQVPNKFIKSVLKDISQRIKDGKSFSESFSAYPQVFSGFYTAMLHAGEIGGNIEAILKRLAGFMEQEEEFKNSVKGALIYPFFILGLSVVTIIVLLTFVIPKLTTMFDDMGQMLPLPTRILLNISGFLGLYWWFLPVLIGIAFFLWKRLYATAQGKASLDRLKLKLPLMGVIVLKSEISRMFRTLALLLSSGIPIESALEVCFAIIENEVLKKDTKQVKEKISSGLSFSKALDETKLFPDLAMSIVRVGEEAGTLEKSLVRIADEYEKDVDRSLKMLIRLLEPIIILVMGLIVGFIVLSMLLPIFQINMVAS